MRERTGRSDGPGTPAAAGPDLLRRIEANVRAVAARGREAFDVGPFRAFISPDSPSYLLSVAVPVAAPDDGDWSPAIAALDSAFASRGRRPRLEFLQERHPDLGAALAAAGYLHTMSAPVMVLSPTGLRPPRRVPGATLVRLAPGDEATLDAFLAMQVRAYGATPGEADESWRSMMRAGLADGTIRAAALGLDGELVSGAALLLGAAAAELAGVGTLPERRRRGLAGDVCGRLLEPYFGDGHSLCWLSADEAARGVYEGLGFRAVAEQRNYGRPPG